MENTKQVIRFLATALGLYVLWYLVYDLWLFPDGRLDTWLSFQEVNLSSELLSVVGYAAAAKGDTLTINNFPVVAVGNPCNAMVLFALFAGFIVAYPGPWKHKLYYIPAGIFMIYLLNVLRIVALALNSFHSRHTLEFNHKYTFAAIVYCCIFLFWMLWVKRYAKPAANYITAS